MAAEGDFDFRDAHERRIGTGRAEFSFVGQCGIPIFPNRYAAPRPGQWCFVYVGPKHILAWYVGPSHENPEKHLFQRSPNQEPFPSLLRTCIPVLNLPPSPY